MATSIMSSRSVRSVRDDYLELIRRFPLRAIRNEMQLKQAHRVLDELSIIDEEKLTPGQGDYLYALSDLVWVYEQQQHPVDLAEGEQADGIDVLRHVLHERGLSASDLGRLLGNRSLGNAILRRQRQLSKANIVTLSRHFRISTDALLRTRRGET